MGKHLTIAERYAGARESGVPLVGGHRGNSAELPENTIAAYESAIALGVDLIECDVHLSADGELIVIHDHALDRTTNGSGLVLQHSFEELRALDAGQGQRLPTLAEVCDVVRDRVGLCIETKQLPLPYLGLERQLVTVLRELGMVDQACVISFSHPSIRLVKELEPGLQVGAIEGARPMRPVEIASAALADIYAPQWAALDPELVDELHEAGKVVAAWTVDDRVGAAWCRHCGPDSVFTNRPREILPQLRA
ncbi:MAG: glycerophosphodiester phosphodiesterase family protein [Candidatus Dormiibacterota bacterium]